MLRTKRKKQKVEKGRDSGLETFLRFEIVITLFALIGFYYFLSFSPVRMPREPIRSPCQLLAPLPSTPKVKTGEQVANEPDMVKKPAVGEETPVSVVGTEGNPALPPASLPVSESPSLPAAPAPGGEKPNDLVTERARETTFPATPAVVPAAAPQEEMQPFSDGGSPAVARPGNEKEDGSETKAEIAGSEAVSSTTVPPGPAEETISPAPVSAVQSKPRKPSPPVAIVVGDYVLSGDLGRARAQLEDLGLVYRIESKKLPTPMYRVYLGPYRQRDQARRMLARSRKMGDDPFLDKGEHGYQVIISSFYLQDNVAAWQKKYRAAGLDLKVLKESLPIEHKFLVVETTGLKEDPESLLARLQAAGFDKARLRPISPANPPKM